jgi:broad specificity phosphatase PhoE
MKTVYFIRHGQSTGNASIVRQQGSHTALTPKGEQQAKSMAAHMKKFPLEALFASPFARAKATGEVLGSETGLPITFSELFIERRRPSIQIRKAKIHPRFAWAQLHLILFSRFKSYRYSDEETPEDLLQRARTALAYLAEQPQSTIAVVTHGFFMRAMYAYMTLGEGVTGRAYLALTRTMRVHNTALMIATYDEGVWNVTEWNVDASSI